MAWLRPRLTYANVAATLALVIALSGGTAYAVGTIKGSQIASNAIVSRHLKAGAVGSSDLAGAAVTSSAVKDGTLTRRDLAAGVLTHEAFATHGSSVLLSTALSGSYQLVATTDGAIAAWSGAYLGPIALSGGSSGRFFPWSAVYAVGHTGAGTGHCRLTGTSNGTTTTTYPSFPITGTGRTQDGTAAYYWLTGGDQQSIQYGIECALDTGSLTITGAELTVVAAGR